MLRSLFTFRRRESLRFGLRHDARGRFRNQRFASFLGENNRGRANSDLYDAVLRSRKWMKNLLRLGLAGGVAWVVLESAKALSVF